MSAYFDRSMIKSSYSKDPQSYENRMKAFGLTFEELKKIEHSERYILKVTGRSKHGGKRGEPYRKGIAQHNIKIQKIIDTARSRLDLKLKKQLTQVLPEAQKATPAIKPTLSEPQKIKRSQEVINQTGDGYYTRNTWRTTRRQVYPSIQLDESSDRTQNFPILLLISGAAIVGLLLIMRGRKK